MKHPRTVLFKPREPKGNQPYTEVVVEIRIAEPGIYQLSLTLWKDSSRAPESKLTRVPSIVGSDL